MSTLQKYQQKVLNNFKKTGNKVGNQVGGDKDAYEAIILPRCKGVHLFHKTCLDGWQQSKGGEFLDCPVCQTIYGIRTGAMGDGTMEWQLIGNVCEGYNQNNTILITYSIDSGKKEDGTPFTGTYWQCFMPDTKKGIIVFKMLVEAFKRRLTYTIGRSLSLGTDNATVWNIHHKTSLDGGVE